MTLKYWHTKSGIEFANFSKYPQPPEISGFHNDRNCIRFVYRVNARSHSHWSGCHPVKVSLKNAFRIENFVKLRTMSSELSSFPKRWKKRTFHKKSDKTLRHQIHCQSQYHIDDGPQRLWFCVETKTIIKIVRTNRQRRREKNGFQWPWYWLSSILNLFINFFSSMQFISYSSWIAIF